MLSVVKIPKMLISEIAERNGVNLQKEKKCIHCGKIVNLISLNPSWNKTEYICQDCLKEIYAAFKQKDRTKNQKRCNLFQHTL